MTLTTTVRPPDVQLRSALRLAACFALLRLCLQFALTLYSNHIGYGYFRDEFYYIACGRHLAWGYVDHGPAVAVQARLGELLFGDSVFGIRVLSAAAGASMVFLTGVVCWALGGRRPAQALAMLCALLANGLLAISGYLSMNSFEPVFWMTSLLALLMVLQGRSERLWWLVFGISAGIGLLNKPSMTFFLVSLGVGLLCTPQRRVLLSRWTLVGIALASAIALPNVLWQIHHHWPTLEFLRNGQKEGKNIVLSPLAFLGGQLVQLNPITALVWVPGLVALLRAKSIHKARWIGIAYLIFVPMMYALHAKDYYLEPFYPALFAAGGIAWAHRFASSPGAREDRLFAFPIAEGAIALLCLATLPMGVPVLKPYTWVRYADAIHARPKEQESGDQGVLPQFFSDRFGWNEEVHHVIEAYKTLTPEEQKRVCIHGTNYGDAGAIDFLGRRWGAGLPPAISGHNSYWMWGTHGCDPNVTIGVYGASPEKIGAVYDSVQSFGAIDNPLAMPFEQKRHIYLLRGRKATEPFNWADERFYY